MNGTLKKTLMVACAAGGAHLASAEYRIEAMHYVELKKNAQATTSRPIQTAAISKVKSSDAATVSVDPGTVVHEALTGIGGAFNEQGGEAFMRLPEAKRKELAEALFNPETGAGFSMCRTAIGSSDFGLGAYSYSETPDDFEMKHFSVERDTKSVIPFMLAAKAENPDLKIFASPWSPPGWMKNNGRMDTTDAGPTRARNPNDKNNALKSDPKVYAAYALYFSKYVQGYAEHGVTIDRIIIQNETDMNPIYPGCNMLPEQMSELVCSHVRPQFEKDGLKAGIWAGSFRGRGGKARNDGDAFMKLEGRTAIDGIGLQYAQPQIVKALRKNYPDMPLMHTEGKCFNSRNDVKQASSRFSEVADWLYSGVENYCYWNMVLNETSRSGWGWNQNSLVKVDRDAGTITYNNDFAPMALFSRFIRPGDQLVQVGGQKAVAVKNRERLVVFLQNNGAQPAARTIDVAGQSVTVELPAESICAFVFK